VCALAERSSSLSLDQVFSMGFRSGELQGQGSKNVTLYLDGEKTERTIQSPGVIDIEMEPRSICLIEVQ
jgi:hypothetical protein